MVQSVEIVEREWSMSGEAITDDERVSDANE